MTNQSNYIVCAFLVIIAAGSVFLFVSKLDSRKPVERFDISYHRPSESPKKIELTSEPFIGKRLFREYCGACHNFFSDDGDILKVENFMEREPWLIPQNIYDFIRDPAAFHSKSGYKPAWITEARMPAFPNLTNAQIDAICEYIRNARRPELINYKMTEN